MLNKNKKLNKRTKKSLTKYDLSTPALRMKRFQAELFETDDLFEDDEDDQEERKGDGFDDLREYDSIEEEDS